MILFAFDMILVAVLLFAAWRSCSSASLFGGVVAFIVFGLLMALAWLRLHAPDIALAEAAVGAGVTGALLLATVGRINRASSGSGQ